MSGFLLNPFFFVTSTGPWLSGYSYRKTITISNANISADLTNFPLDVLLSSSNFDFTHALSTGYDVKFTSSDATTLLSFEREYYDSTNSRAKFHIKIPSVSTSANTIIYMYYGNASATDTNSPADVWDSNYVGVWHLGTVTTDSTANDNDGTATGTTANVSTTYGLARDFNGSSDTVTIPNDSTLNFSSAPFTITAFYKDAVTTGSNRALITKTTAYSNNRLNYAIDQDSSDGTVFKTSDSSGTTGHYTAASSITDFGTTNYIVSTGRYEASKSMKLYTNGSLRTSVTATYNATENTGALYLGSFYTNTFFYGTYVDARISNIARSDAWIQAESFSMKLGLHTVGAETTP